VLGSQLNLASLFPTTALAPPLHCHVPQTVTTCPVLPHVHKMTSTLVFPGHQLVPKQAAITNLAQPSGVPPELGEYIDRDVELLR
jgi:hypothetical protein